MRKLMFSLYLVLTLIGFPSEVFAADALYRMLHADEVESFREDQDAMIVGQLIGEKANAFEVEVLKVLSGKVNSDRILVSNDFTYGWNKEDPLVGDFAVFSLKRTESQYKKAWGVFKADSGDFETLRLLPLNAPTPGLLADLASIEWYTNSGGRENDFSFVGNGYETYAYVKNSEGGSLQIYPKLEEGQNLTGINSKATQDDNANLGTSTVKSRMLRMDKANNPPRGESNGSTFLAQSLVGWPGIITSFLLSVLGLIRKRSFWLVLGAIFALPISLYLGATPRFRYFMAFLPAFQFIAAYFIYKRKKSWMAWLLVSPFVSVMIWLGTNMG